LFAARVTIDWVRRDPKRSSLFPCSAVRFFSLSLRSFDSGSSSEFLRFEHRSPSFDDELNLFQGSGPHRGITELRPLSSRGFPFLPLRFVLRFSQPLDVFLRGSAGGLVSSRNHVQDQFLFRGFSLRAAVPSFSSEGRYPLVVGSGSLTSRLVSTNSKLRLRGFFSARSSVSIVSLLMVVRSPLQVSALLQVRARSPSRLVTRPRPLMALFPFASHFAIRSGPRLQRVHREEL